MELVSVIIPVKNRIVELHRSIKSVLNQTYQNFEVIVIDDKSVNDINDVIISFSDSRLKYLLNNKEISNANVCRNIGIYFAKGEYIAMLDSDDEWLPDHLEKRLELFRSNKSIDGVFGSYILNDGVLSRVILSRPLREGEKMINYLLSDGSAVTPSQMYKTESVKTVMWDETLFRHQDYDFSIRFSQKFNFISIQVATCIVHWKKGERRAEHFESLMKFISKYKYDIEPIFYAQYHRYIYVNISMRKDINSEIKKHYSRESIRYIKLLSLNDYISTFGVGKTTLYRFILRLEFCFRVLFS